MTIGRIARIAFFASLAVLVSALIASSGSRPAAKAQPHPERERQCKPVGGAILTNVGGFGAIDGNPTTFGVVTGDLKGAVGVEILGVSPSGTTFTVQHHWVTDTGETLAIDRADAHGTYVAPGLFAITEYKGHLAGGSGRFAGATGNLSFIGEIDFNANPGQVVLRYSGQVCFAEQD